MRGIRLDARLAAAAGLVRPGAAVVDVGTDHALLPCFLFLQGHEQITACDIAEGPLLSARETLRTYGIPEAGENARGVRLLLSDGLEGIAPPSGSCDIIIAGMGGETIAEIITRCRWLVEHDVRLILQPMTRHAELRRALCSRGFAIMNEVCAVSGGRHYTVLHSAFSGEFTEIGDEYAYIGAQTDPGYIRAQIAKLRRMANADPRYLALAERIEAALTKE